MLEGPHFFLRQADVQSSVYGLHFCQGWIYFLVELMDGLDVRAAIRFAGAFLSAVKDHQTASGQTQDGGHLRVPRTINNQRKIRCVEIIVAAPEFLLGSELIVESETMLVLAFFKNLVSAFCDC
jgi:hypothetical protein